MLSVKMSSLGGESTCKQDYTSDVKLPGMLTAVTYRSAAFG